MNYLKVNLIDSFFLKQQTEIKCKDIFFYVYIVHKYGRFKKSYFT